MMAAGRSDGGVLRIEDVELAAIRARHPALEAQVRAAVAATPVAAARDSPCYAVKPSPWPIWAMLMAKLRNPGDIGVGDTVERTIGTARSATFKAWHLATFGHPCGCERRKTEWNSKYRYPSGKL